MKKKQPPWDIKRGRHRKHASVETQEWNREYLIPTCPPWMDEEAYHKLVRLRNEQERGTS
jgi:hypothetical protein